MKWKTLFNSSLFLRVVLLLSLFVILIIGGLSYRHISNLTNSTEIVVKTYTVNVELEHIISYLRDAESGYKDYTATKDTFYIESYLNAKEKIDSTFLNLNKKIIANTEQQENLSVLNKLADQLFENFSKTCELVKNDDINYVKIKKLLFEEKIIMDTIRHRANIMFDLENKLLNERQKEYQSDLQFTPLFFYSVVLLTLVLIILAYNKISNDLKNIKAKNDQLLIFKESSNQSEIIGKHGNWVWHIESNVFTYSDNLYRLLGEEPQSFEATLDNFLKFVHPEDVDKLTQELSKMITVEELPFINYRIIQKSGLIKHLKSYAKSFFSVSGQKILLGNTSDITEEIESIIELEERNIELERNNKELSAFNYIASHDLQEPLRKILTFVSRLEEKDAANFSDSGHQYLERIKSASTRMRLLIDDLLKFSRTNKPDKEFIVADLNELFKNAMQDASVYILEKRAQIISGTLPKATVITFQIQQLFLNLLSNSLKYTKKETAPVIEINYSKVEAKDEPHLLKASKSDYHKITFTDNGIGFNQEYAEKIFNLFERLHNKKDYSGSGIGLSICKKIIENHNGYIFAKGEINVGSVFTIYLPII